MGQYIRKADEYDVLIVAEGTFPYVKGGVSSWIYQLITGLKELKFGVVFLGSRPEDYGSIEYNLPDNLVHLEVHYLFSELSKPVVEKIKYDENSLKTIDLLHKWFKNKETFEFPDKFKSLDFYNNKIPYKHFLYGESSWEFIVKQYSNNCPEHSFIDYFWTVRNIHGPIWEISKIAENIKGFKVIHSPSTGYAGMLGALLHVETNASFILTEHGIYTRERKIDLLNADWIKDKRTIFQKELGEVDYLKYLWVKFFEGIGKIAYSAANPIVSLFNDARNIQISHGAPPEKTKVIPNGVDVSEYERLITLRGEEVPKVISLIGRVVPIKDIKTFIKAMRIVVSYFPDVQGWIVGPEDEDPDYVRECKFLVETLDLEKNVKFLGYQNVKDILPRTGILTLTSISEGMPLVIMEAFASGVPAVTTDVGSCRQLIYGGIDEEDIKIGKAGEVVSIANPSELAEAYIKILDDENLWRKYQNSAIKRIKKYYTKERFLNSYRELFEEAITKWQELALN